MPAFRCLAVFADGVASTSCQCTACQEEWRPASAEVAGTVSAVPAMDIPGDATSNFSITVGTPLNGILEFATDHDWYRVELVAGTRYIITLDGFAFDSNFALEDPYIYLRRADGSLITEDDDDGPGRNSLLHWIAPASGVYYLDAGAWDEKYIGGYQLSISEFVVPNYSLDQIADFLTSGYWGGPGHRWDTRADNIITYNVTALTSAGQFLARSAFQAWAHVTNLVFQEVTSGGDIPFDDNQSGAFAAGTWSNGLITSMRVNISTGWLAMYGTTIDSYSFQTYVHEIGHALGLGHGGPYNGSATYGRDNVYVNDIWSYTIMSYFDQVDAGFGSYRYVMGPSLADIVAIQNLYGGNTSFNSGNNVYGRNATAGSLYDFASYAHPPAFTIYDTGGADTLDASGYAQNQIIDLNAEAFSSIGGLTNNIAIARGVELEAARGGDGSDSILGNGRDNFLWGNAGADTLIGDVGGDTLSGGAGDDRLDGGAGVDLADYSPSLQAITIDLALEYAFVADFGTDTLHEIEGVLLGAGDDSALGDARDNIISGGLGQDTLIGNAGNDTLLDDGLGAMIDGGAGDDVILLGGTHLADIMMLFGPWA